MTDKQLLEQISQKNKQAFKTLYDRYRKLFFGWVFSRLNDEDASCDLTQDFWMGVWTSPQKIQCDEAGSAKNWLLRHLSFQIMDYFRTQCRRLEITDEVLLQQKMQTLVYTHIQEDMDFIELQKIINGILQELPPIIQKIYELRCVQNFSAKETSKALGIAESTVYNNVSTTLSTLRRELSLQYSTSNPDELKTLLIVWIVLFAG